MVKLFTPPSLNLLGFWSCEMHQNPVATNWKPMKQAICTYQTLCICWMLSIQFGIFKVEFFIFVWTKAISYLHSCMFLAVIFIDTWKILENTSNTSNELSIASPNRFNLLIWILCATVTSVSNILCKSWMKEILTFIRHFRMYGGYVIIFWKLVICWIL